MGSSDRARSLEGAQPLCMLEPPTSTTCTNVARMGYGNGWCVAQWLPWLVENAVTIEQLYPYADEAPAARVERIVERCSRVLFKRMVIHARDNAARVEAMGPPVCLPRPWVIAQRALVIVRLADTCNMLPFVRALWCSEVYRAARFNEWVFDTEWRCYSWRWKDLPRCAVL